jgi:hypothetical protein
MSSFWGLSFEEAPRFLGRKKVPTPILSNGALNPAKIIVKIGVLLFMYKSILHPLYHCLVFSPSSWNFLKCLVWAPVPFGAKLFAAVLLRDVNYKIFSSTSASFSWTSTVRTVQDNGSCRQISGRKFSAVEIHFMFRRDHFLQILRISSAENFKVKTFFILWLRYWQLLSLTKHHTRSFATG